MLALAFVAMSVRGAAADINRYGVMTDVGVPDGANASLVVRPIRMLQLHGGVGSNGVTTGMRAGVTVVPLSWWCSPSVSLDVGRYPEGDANWIVRKVMSDPTFMSPTLERVGYDYLDAHVGLELGSKRVTFYIHAGASRIVGNLRNLSDPAKGVTFSDDPKVTLWSPSVRIGLIVYAF